MKLGGETTNASSGSGVARLVSESPWRAKVRQVVTRLGTTEIGIHGVLKLAITP